MGVQPADWIGHELNDGAYVVRSHLRQGGMAYVYLAEHRPTGRSVVVKAPIPDRLDGTGARARFLREVRAMLPLTHPSIVRVTDAGEHQGIPFAVLDYLPGGTLRDRQSKGPDGRPERMPAGDVLRWLAAVAGALDSVHRMGFVHRDVKPENILFDAEGDAYLGDFGIAKALDGPERALRPETLVTEANAVLGTPQYMAPELIRGKGYDGRADQYALAVVAYEWLGGRHPFPGSAPGELLVMHCTEDWPTLSGPGLPASVDAILRRAGSREPARRYPTCTEFAAVLASVFAGDETAAEAGERVACPACGARLRLPPNRAGMLLKCKRCHLRFGLYDAGAKAPRRRGESKVRQGARPNGPPHDEPVTATLVHPPVKGAAKPARSRKRRPRKRGAWNWCATRWRRSPLAHVPLWCWALVALVVVGVAVLSWRANRKSPTPAGSAAVVAPPTATERPSSKAG